jgi:hypothetical protein
MPESDFLEEIDSQILDFRRRAIRCRNLFLVLKSLQIAAGGAIAVVAVWAPLALLARADVLLAFLLGTIETVLQTFQFHLYWVRNRMAQRALERERLRYKGGARPYFQNPELQPSSLLSERVDEILEAAHNGWALLSEKTAIDLKNRPNSSALTGSDDGSVLMTTVRRSGKT